MNAEYSFPYSWRLKTIIVRKSYMIELEMVFLEDITFL
jgi:hypothetical protein